MPHHKDKLCKFIDFEDDGYEVSKHIGLVETTKDKKQHLVDVWFNRIEAQTKFYVKTTIEADDDWLHSFYYYFNDEILSEEDFRNTIADYITFEVNIITHGRGYLFGIGKIFNIENCRCNRVSSLKDGSIPYVGAINRNNGVVRFVEYDINLIT